MDLNSPESWRRRPNTTRNSLADRSLRRCASLTSTSPYACSPATGPAEIPHDVLGLTYARHWRLLSAMANPSAGRISRGLAALSGEDRERLRRPHPDLIEVLDPRATSLLAADLLETTGPTSMLIAETMAAAIRQQSEIYVGDPQNAVGPMRKHARTLGVEIVIVAPQ